MASKIAILCGGDGVGKTTVSLALALKHAASGTRVLVVTSHPLPELAIAVSLEGLSAQYPAAVKNLFIVHLDPVELLRDIVNRSFPVAAAEDKMVRSAIFRNLVEVAPGLKSFYFLARLQDLAQRRAQDGESPQYELLIWDAPPTSQFLAMLRSARKFEYHRSGPLATAGVDVARFFSAAGNVAVTPVTTLDEANVAETIEITEALEREFQWRGARVVLNLHSPLLTVDSGITSGDPALDFLDRRGQVERDSAEFLAHRLGLPAVTVPRLFRNGPDLAMLGQIAGRLDFSSGAS